MQLKNEETIIKVYHHHSTPFILRTFKIVVVSLPFFLVASFFNGVLSALQMTYFYTAIAIFFCLFIAYDLLIFSLDTLTVTNHRIVLVSWKNLFSRSEAEADMSDIQDITTIEHGLFSAIPFFDYGSFKLDTASAKTILLFNFAPDPEGIKHFIYHLQIKPSRIGPVGFVRNSHDSAREEIAEEDVIAGSRQ